MLETGLYNMDCMDGMKMFPDKFFDLAIVDPPYGNAANANKSGLVGGQLTGTARPEDLEDGSHVTICRTGGTWAAKYSQGGIFDDADIRTWDVAPDDLYFRELARVSNDQIIWGGNYFDLPPTRCFIVWRKTNIPKEGFSMAPVEYAWTSFPGNAAYVEASSQGNTEKRFHPTQKPISLYTWLLNHYAKPGYKILDTHVGSASSLIACHRAGLEYWGFETHKGYFDMATKRLETERTKIKLFAGND